MPEEVLEDTLVQPTTPAEVPPVSGTPPVLEPQSPSNPVTAGTVATSEPCEGLITSSSHKREWNMLDRVSKGPRAKQYPQIALMFRSGNKEEKLQALRAYVTSGESLEATESEMVVQRSHKEKFNHKKAWMTIREMKDAKFSKHLSCTLDCSCL